MPTVYGVVRKIDGSDITNQKQRVEILMMDGENYLVAATTPAVITTDVDGTFVVSLSGYGRYWFRVNEATAKEDCITIDLIVGSSPANPLVLKRVVVPSHGTLGSVYGRINNSDGSHVTATQTMEWDQDGAWFITHCSDDVGRYDVTLPPEHYNVDINGHDANPVAYTIAVGRIKKNFKTDYPRMRAAQSAKEPFAKARPFTKPVAKKAAPKKAAPKKPPAKKAPAKKK